MTTYVMIPGAGGAAWYWSRVVPLLEAAGHTAIAIELPADDETAGLSEYAQLVVDAIGDRTDVALIAQSLGGFTAPLVCEATRVDSVTLVNAMIPVPHETPGDWWENTGSSEARAKAAAAGGYRDDIYDADTYFFHDVSPAIVAEGESHQRPESEAAFASTCDFTSWAAGRVRAVAGRDDRLFPLEFQRRVAKERLGVDIDVVPGGHLVALAHPDLLAEYLLQP
jgi:hypothetical protein